MPRLLTLSRAARLVGLTRGALQRHVAAGELTSFEGMISLSELNTLYPQAKLEDNSLLEKIDDIIERARFKARNRHQLPLDHEALAARVNLLGDELVQTKHEIGDYAILAEKLKSKLKELIAKADTETQAKLINLQQWFANELHGIEQATNAHNSLLVQDTLLRIIAPQVRLLPSGHEFFVEGNNTILESGLSAGYALNYGCSNGNCGECKAKLLSGKVKQVKQHDYAFSESEKLQNHILMCCNTALTELVLETKEAGNEQDIPQQTISAKVKKLERLNDHISILHLKPPRTKRLRFLSGQCATLSLNDKLQKTLSIASCPCDDMNIQFHIPMHMADGFTEYLNTKLKPGDQVSLNGPDGQFILDEDLNSPLIFIAMNTGFAPIKGLIEHAITLDNAEFISLYWFAEDAVGQYMENLAHSWTDAFDSFQYVPYLLQRDAAGQLQTPNLMQQLDGIAHKYPELSDFRIYIAGSDEFIALSQDYLLKSGAVKENLFTDNCESK